MLVADAIAKLADQLEGLYDADEANRIARYAMEDALSINNDTQVLNQIQQQQWQSICVRLLMGEPLQYVTNVAWFYCYKMYVAPGVLIPRPETEELIYYALPYLQKHRQLGSVLDLGTGSGCIANTLSLKGINNVVGVDISPAALNIAQKNAKTLNSKATFIQANMLQADWSAFPAFGHVVSNPPYISPSELPNLALHVRAHEPAVALFTPTDASVTIFYEVMIAQCGALLPINGSLWCELHPEHAAKVLAFAVASGVFEAEIIKDMSGKNRILKAIKVR